jgi:hypothetical protein
VLERAPRPATLPDAEGEATAIGNGGGSTEATPKGRGGRASKPAAKPKATGRTIYLDDDLFERVLVQAHRKKLTISDYVAGLLNRHVPDHRRIQAGPAAEAGDDAA